MNKIYISNFSHDETEQSLRDFFSVYGPIEGIELIIDRDSGISRGFAFITFAANSAATAACTANGTLLNGRAIRVSPAHIGAQIQELEQSQPI